MDLNKIAGGDFTTGMNTINLVDNAVNNIINLTENNTYIRSKPLGKYNLKEFIEFLKEKTGYKIPTLASILGIDKVTLYNWQGGKITQAGSKTIAVIKPVLKEKFNIEVNQINADTLEAKEIEELEQKIPLASSPNLQDKEYINNLERIIVSLMKEKVVLQDSLSKCKKRLFEVTGEEASEI